MNLLSILEALGLDVPLTTFLWYMLLFFLFKEVVIHSVAKFVRRCARAFVGEILNALGRLFHAAFKQARGQAVGPTD